MRLRPLLFFASILLLCQCGVYLEHPPLGNNVQWKLLQYNDTAIYSLRKQNALIDSVLDVTNNKTHIPLNPSHFKLAGSDLTPGINEVNLLFYSDGKRRRSIENLYMVSETEPEQIIVEDYYLLPHDQQAFTQGLIFWNSCLYESTGLVGFSSLRRLNCDTGEIIDKINLNPEVFAEGIGVIDSAIFVLTWKDGLIYKFNKDLEQIKVHPYRNEGWGLTSNNNTLFASDGTNKLYQLSSSFDVDGVTEVFNHRGPVSYLNELEWIHDHIWANVLGSDKVIVINPANGKVEKEIDVSMCIDRNQYKEAGVLNGIAFDKDKEVVYLTGKNWPYIIVWHPHFFDKSNN